ncbi:hypothetical protein JWJ90_22235 [Desulfobulbus rhabdoformis]|uniref:hypothetical protein n=1 Tax=Desulfobulbus rhabdoformis TaxID=34032 RepID=UPI0019667A85|nr:hypothetical protein [Desulfobulbus rhabdoformis]MBM9616983.1 hypothetical protein [Desulfobulbus rhabdoformis]
MKYPKVIFIGGAPMIGKTTTAYVIASRLQYGCISSDDIGSGVSAVTNPISHPAFHYMSEYDYREYYIERKKDDLIQDINNQHETLWPALLNVFQNHSTWGTSTVIEGWALRPDYITQLSGDIDGLFLVADDALIEKRVRSSDFSEGASDKDAMIRKYIERSLWYNSYIRTQVAHLSLKQISISVEMQPEEIADKCMEKISIIEKAIIG